MITQFTTTLARGAADLILAGAAVGVYVGLGVAIAISILLETGERRLTP